MKLGKWRSRTNITFKDTNFHHPLLIFNLLPISDFLSAPKQPPQNFNLRPFLSDNPNSAPNSNNSSASNPNYSQPGGFNHPQFLYQASAPTMSTSSTSSQSSHFAYQAAPAPYAPHHPAAAPPNLRMLLPGHAQFYAPDQQRWVIE